MIGKLVELSARIGKNADPILAELSYLIEVTLSLTYGVVAGTGQNASAARLFLLFVPWIVTTSNTHSVIVSGASVITLVQAPLVTVIRG
jgi:hypothetical protein